MNPVVVTLIAAVCLIVCWVLFHYSSAFRLDAAPIGSFMIAASAVALLAGTFLIGVIVGWFVS